MGVGRLVCMVLPFGLTIASLICILIVGTSPSDKYYFATFNTSGLNVSVSSSGVISRDLSAVSLEARSNGIAHLTSEALENHATISSSGNVHINATDLGLADKYEIGLWGYCNVTNTSSGSSKRECSKAKAGFYFDPTTIWNLNETSAESALNSSTVTHAIKVYKTAAKWDFALYLVAFVATCAELIFGFIAVFSRIGSCITTIISNISTVAITLASILATVMWAIVVKGFNHELNKYGINGSVNTNMLVATWIAVAFSIASGFFWSISICCCGNTDWHPSSMRRKNRGMDHEKMIPLPYQPATAYQPVGSAGPHIPATQQEYGHLHMAGGNGGKYEPYRHNDL